MKTPQRTMLIASAETNVRVTLRQLVMSDREHRYRLLESDTGRQTVEMCRHEHPDCILLDNKLRDADGVEILQTIGDEFGVHAFPVVFLIDDDALNTAASALRNGAQNFLVKDHFKTEDLQRAIKDAIQIVALLQNSSARGLSHVHLAAIVNLSADAIYSYDFDGRILFWNSGAERLFGYTKAEMIGRNIAEIFPGKMGREIEGFIAASKAGRSIANFETLRQKSDGEYFTALLTVSPIADAAGLPIAVSVIARDITEYKETLQRLEQSEESLRQANERFRIAEAASNGFIYDLDVITNEEVRSDGFQKVLGYTNDDFPSGGAEWEKLIHPDDVARVRSRTESMLATGTLKVSDEYRLRHKSGHWVWVMDEYISVRTEQDKIQRIVGSIVDITERKQAELDALFLVDLAAQILKSNDSDALIRSVTQATGEYFEASHCVFCEIDLAQGMAIVKHDQHAAHVPPLTGPYELDSYIAEDIAAFAAGETVCHSDLRSDPRTAQFFETGYAPLHIRAMWTSPLMREGRWVALLVVTHDEPRVWTNRAVALLRTVAERTWLALENVRLQAEMHALNTSLELRVAERTFELRESQTQLRKLSVYVERLREDERTRIAREVHDQLGGALTGLKMSLVHAIRGLDNAMSNDLQDVKHQIDALVQTVRRIASDLRPPLLDDFGLIVALDWQAREWEKRTGIKSTLAMPSEDIPLDRECRTAVFRVFQECLTNIARHAHATQVDVKVEINSEHLVLMIKDNGGGIPGEALKPGKSLGLLGMQERIRDISGELDITGAPGQGTTVTIKVPVSRENSK